MVSNQIKSGIKLETVADKLGLTTTGLKKSFDNCSLSFENMVKLSELLGVPFQFFDEMAPEPISGANEGAASYSKNEAKESELEFLKWLFDERARLRELLEKGG